MKMPSRYVKVLPCSALIRYPAASLADLVAGSLRPWSLIISIRPVICPPSSTCSRRQRAVPSTLPVARTTSAAAHRQCAVDRAGDLGVLHLDLALEHAAGAIESSLAWIMLASTVPSTTSRSASCTVPWTLIPRPTTSVRRSAESRTAGRLGISPGRAVGFAVGGVTAEGENGGRDMAGASFGGAGR